MKPITIEQTKEEMALAFEVHRNAVICAVRLRRSKMAGQTLEEAPEGPIRVKFTVRSRSATAPKGTLRVEVDFRMAGEIEAQAAERQTSKTQTVASVDCTYVVDYQLREGFEASAKQIKAFKDGNVIFNCWPYFREYLQESVQRMGLPPLTAPFLRVQMKAPKAVKIEPEKT